MDGFIKVQVTYVGGEFVCWQHVVGGTVVGFVDAGNQPVAMPDVYECAVLDRNLKPSPV